MVERPRWPSGPNRSAWDCCPRCLNLLATVAGCPEGSTSQRGSTVTLWVWRGGRAAAAATVQTRHALGGGGVWPGKERALQQMFPVCGGVDHGECLVTETSTFADLPPPPPSASLPDMCQSAPGQYADPARPPRHHVLLRRRPPRRTGMNHFRSIHLPTVSGARE